MSKARTYRQAKRRNAAISEGLCVGFIVSVVLGLLGGMLYATYQTMLIY